MVVSAPGAPWSVTDGGPVSFSHEYGGEDYNETLAIPGFDAPGFVPAAANPLVTWAPAADCGAASQWLCTASRRRIRPCVRYELQPRPTAASSHLA